MPGGSKKQRIARAEGVPYVLNSTDETKAEGKLGLAYLSSFVEPVLSMMWEFGKSKHGCPAAHALFAALPCCLSSLGLWL